MSRQRLGRYEDRFISTLVLGSGLLFLGIVLVAAALGAAILTAYSHSPAFAGSQTEAYVQFAFSQLIGVYALRMAAVFQHPSWPEPRLVADHEPVPHACRTPLR